MIRIFIVLVALIAFYRPIEEARDIGITDAIEYSFAARNLVTDGIYEFKVGDQLQPPRYAPWFSAIFLAPSYFLLGPDIGNGIYAITISAALIVLFGFMIASREVGALGGLLATALLLINPTFRYLGSEMRADVPLTLFIVLVYFLYQKLRCAKATHTEWLLVGIFAGLAFACKPTGALVLCPLLFAWYFSHSKLNALLLLIAPTFVIFLATAWYNFETFGDPFRSGYNYWLSVPHDVPGLTFSLQYVSDNLIKIARGIAFLGLVTFAAFGQVYRKNLKILEFVLLFSLPYLFLHLTYYYYSPRFLLPVEVLLCLLIGSSARLENRRLSYVLGISIVLLALVKPFNLADSHKLAATFSIIQKETLPGSTILTDAPVSYFEGLEKDGRKYIPFSRHAEYASKVLMLRKPAEIIPPPLNAFDHRAKGLFAAGAKEAIPRVADEMQSELEVLISEGKLYKASPGKVERVFSWP